MSSSGGTSLPLRRVGYFELAGDLELIQIDRPASEAMRSLTAEEFRDVVGHFASGVTVITAVHDGEPFGTTASAVSSLSLEPPMLLICMNRESTTGRAVHASRRFAVNILTEHQAEEAVRFASKVGDKFAGIPVIEGQWGEPLLADALAHLECRVVEEVTGGTHWVFLAEVDHASAQAGTPLAYFRGQFGRLELAQDEEVFSRVREHVLSRDIAVGEALQLDEIVERLDLPRGPVYHALAKLTAEGLVSRDPTGAFVVVPITLEVIENALRSRCAIMLGVATLTVGRVQEDELADLRRSLDALTAPGAPEVDLAGLTGFADVIVGLAGNPALTETFRRATQPAVMMAVELNANTQDLVSRHYAGIVEAYEAADIEAAEKAIQALYESGIALARSHYSPSDRL